MKNLTRYILLFLLAAAMTVFSSCATSKYFVDKPVEEIENTIQYKDSLNANLLRAVKKGDVVAVKELVELGADVNFSDNEGISLLMWSASSNNVVIARLLLDRGAKANYVLNATGEKTSLLNGWPALMWAAYYNSSAVAALFNKANTAAQLLNAKADMNMRDRLNATALGIAEAAASTEVATLLSLRKASR